MMSPDQCRGIDHIVLAVRDLDVARERFNAFGFRTTPRSEHPFGTGNSLVQLGHSFIELLTVVTPENLVPMTPEAFSFSAFSADFLELRQGLAMLVLSSGDARADNDAWRDHGLRVYQPVDFSREATLADGRRVKVAFTIAFAIDPEMTETPFFVCQQHYPENFWQPKYQAHENWARDIVGVTLRTSDPSRHHGFFHTLTPEAAITDDTGDLVVLLPRGRIDVCRPETVEARFSGLVSPPATSEAAFVAATIEVDHLDAVAKKLTAARVDHDRRSAAIHIAAKDCFGMVLEFVSKDR